MFKYLATAAIFLSFAAPSLAIYQMDFPKELIGSTFKAETRLKGSGAPFGESVTRISLKSPNGKTFLLLESSSTGIMEGKPFTSEAYRYYLIDGGKITSYLLRGSTSTKDKPWTEFSLGFNWQNMTCNVSYRDHLKDEKVKACIPLEKNLVAIQDLDLYLSTLPQRKEPSENLKVLLPNGQTVVFLVKMAPAAETLNIKGKPVICRRIEVKPDLGLLNIVMPDVDYWVRSVPPYDLVRFSGPIGGPGSPDVVQEIYKVE